MGMNRFKQIINDGKNEISSLNKVDKFFTLFWILGPFIYLIERDPADLWLTSFCIAFLIKSILKKNFNWLKEKWFFYILIFWFFSLISASLSVNPIHSLKESFVWIRFPLYVISLQYWILKNIKILKLMYLSIFFGAMLLIIILTSEIIYNYHFQISNVRLTWPYGDTVPGNYFAKMGLPLFCLLTSTFLFKTNSKSIYFGLFAALIIIFIFLTGERMNFLITVGALTIILIISKPNIKVFISLMILFLIFSQIIKTFNPSLFNRYKNTINQHLNMSDENGYWGTWRGGIQQGFEKPFLGIGPSMTRSQCQYLDNKKFEFLPGKNLCANHPHNFYIQLFAEIGIFGLLFGIVIFFRIIKDSYYRWKLDYKNPYLISAFVPLLIYFFPFQQTGSFFGQWGNLFLWFGIGLSIATSKIILSK